uniref:Uncharacterized protein n=2 Tax=Ixodes scapularis TaxID=6945 RepID=A0A1S4LHB0_IXOSC
IPELFKGHTLQDHTPPPPPPALHRRRTKNPLSPVWSTRDLPGHPPRRRPPPHPGVSGNRHGHL